MSAHVFVFVSNVLHLRPGIGQNIAMHASPIAIKSINDKLQSLCPFSLCPIVRMDMQFNKCEWIC